MQRLEFNGAVRPLYGSLGVKGLSPNTLELRPSRVAERNNFTFAGRELTLSACCLFQQPSRVFVVFCVQNGGTSWHKDKIFWLLLKMLIRNTVIPRLLLTNFSANEDFFRWLFWTRLTNVLVDARANIKQQTWKFGPFQERSSINVGHIFDFSFSKETEASYWRRGDLPWINFGSLEEE